jgi:hypothetical protein
MIRQIEKLFGCELHYAEYILAGVAVLWGVWLLNPWGVSFGTTKTFQIMAAMAPEEVWGGALALTGLTLIYGLRRDLRWLRRRACFYLFVLWLLVAVATLIANPLSSAFPSYLGYSCLCLFAYLRLSGANI